MMKENVFGPKHLIVIYDQFNFHACPFPVCMIQKKLLYCQTYDDQLVDWDP